MKNIRLVLRIVVRLVSVLSGAAFLFDADDRRTRKETRKPASTL
jgi:hypothetical protein